jgi:dipeptidyl aminopeptidase/acylaminoacyl peptidase
LIVDGNSNRAGVTLHSLLYLSFFLLISLCPVFVCAAQGHAVKASLGDARFEHWRTQILETLFIPASLPLDPQAHGEHSPVAGVTAEKITYGSEFGLTIPAILYRPAAERGRMPAIIVVNGHGGRQI